VQIAVTRQVIEFYHRSTVSRHQGMLVGGVSVDPDVPLVQEGSVNHLVVEIGAVVFANGNVEPHPVSPGVVPGVELGPHEGLVGRAEQGEVTFVVDDPTDADLGEPVHAHGEVQVAGQLHQVGLTAQVIGKHGPVPAVEAGPVPVVKVVLDVVPGERRGAARQQQLQV